MTQLTKGSAEWWEELDDLAEYLKEWAGDKASRELERRVLASMEALGFVTKE